MCLAGARGGICAVALAEVPKIKEQQMVGVGKRGKRREDIPFVGGIAMEEYKRRGYVSFIGVRASLGLPGY